MLKLMVLRKQKGLTQDELSEIAGVSRVTISQIENGKNDNPKYSTLKKIANALEVKVDELDGEIELAG